MRSEKQRSLLLNTLDVLNLKKVNMSKVFRSQASAAAGTLIDGASPAVNCCHQRLTDCPESIHDGPACFYTHPMLQEAEKGAEHAASA